MACQRGDRKHRCEQHCSRERHEHRLGQPIDVAQCEVAHRDVPTQVILDVLREIADDEQHREAENRGEHQLPEFAEDVSVETTNSRHQDSPPVILGEDPVIPSAARRRPRGAQATRGDLLYGLCSPPRVRGSPTSARVANSGIHACPGAFMRSALVVTALAAVVLSQTAVAQTGGGRQGGRGGGRGTPIAAGESCPPGTTEIRPRSCMAPELAPPSILDYRPHSTLVVPVHMVKTAKYPAIDFHGHPQGLLTPEGVGTLVSALDSLNVRMMVSADNMSGDRLQRAVSAVRGSDKAKDRVRILAGINFQNVGPGWAEKAIKQLE